MRLYAGRPVKPARCCSGEGALLSTRALGELSGLASPCCRSYVTWSSADGRCTACSGEYTITDGVPILVAADTPDSGSRAHKEEQAAYFDKVEAEWEITRPIGAPRFYRWLIEEKFRRSVSALRPLLTGASALVVCGGSGMDAEFLARAGARVILADISLGAAQRARERASRFAVEITPIVADAERLPFADRSFDLVYVHDGLHHLERPQAGLAEIARVAARAVSINEPARAAVTQLAVRLGLSQTVEDAGNRIERMDPEMIIRELEARDFRVLAASRYAMVYRHRPGPVSWALSRPGLFEATRSGITLFNAVAGGVGNKLTVQAIRR